MRTCVFVSILGCFLFLGPPALSIVESPRLEDLERTIKEYYTAIQKNQWKQAEKYVWKKSLRKFREEARGENPRLPNPGRQARRRNGIGYRGGSCKGDGQSGSSTC